MNTPQMPTSSLLRTSAMGCTDGLSNVRAIVSTAPNISTEKNTAMPYQANLSVTRATNTFIAGSATTTTNTTASHESRSSMTMKTIPVMIKPTTAVPTVNVSTAA